MRFISPCGREGHVEHLVAAGAREHVELELEPAAVVGAHVHRQRLGDGAQAARLLGAVHPHFERHRRPWPSCSMWPTNRANSPPGVSIM
jgi:hypothetical protein